MPLARFAEAAYSSKSVRGYTIDKSLSNKNYTTYYNPNDKTAVISFSGTRIFNDPNYFGIPQNGIWETDLATDWAVASNDIRGSIRYNECLSAAEDFYEKYHGKGYHVATTGHSLGGRIAMEVSADLRSDNKTVIAEVYNPFFYDHRVDLYEGDYDYCIVHYNPNDPYSRNVANLPPHGHATLIPSTPQTQYKAVARRNPETITTPSDPQSSNSNVPPSSTKPTVPPTSTKPQPTPPAHHKESIWHWLGKEAKHHPWEFAAAIIGGAVIAAGAAAIIGPAIAGAIAGEGAVEGAAAAGTDALVEGAAEGAAESAAESAADGVAGDTSEFVDAVSEQPEEIPKTEEEPFHDAVEEQPAEAPIEEVADTFGSDSIPNLEQQIEDINNSVDHLNFSDAEAPTTDAEQALFRSTAQRMADEIFDLPAKILRKSISLAERVSESLATTAQSGLDTVSETAGRQVARQSDLFLRTFMQELSQINPALAGYLKSIVSLGQTLGVVDAATASSVGVTSGITIQTQIAAATGVVMTGVVFVQTAKEFFQACKLFLQEMNQLINLIKQNQKEIDQFLEELVGKDSHSLNQYTSHEPVSVLPGSKSSAANLSTVSTIAVHKPSPVLPAQKKKNHYVVKAKYNNRHR